MSTPKFLEGLLKTKVYSNKPSYEDLINAESALGRTIFGPVPAGHQREFFLLKDNAWLWYEGYLDNSGKQQSLVVRYEVRPTGVYKSVSGGGYEKIIGRELDNFKNAAYSYLKLVKTKLYC
ncbi:hypothetical protein J6S37_01270 [Candidatus Saccharibacteria bacterium]|nr:hypothetical protein [Candidatus Saccharibacteria bacterium]